MKTLLLSTLFLFYSFVGISQLFGEEVQLNQTCGTPFDFQHADLDGDGYQDLIVALRGSGIIACYKNLSGEGFSEKIIIDSDAKNANEILCDDLNDDGLIDVLSAHGGEISLYTNSSNFNFTKLTLIQTENVSPVGVESADMDGDGLKDVVGAYSSSFIWRKSLGGDSFAQQQVFEISPFNHQQSLNLEDLNGDGLKDLISCETYGGGVVWFPNEGDFSFGTGIELPGNPNSVWKIYTTDIDEDNDFDIMCTSAGGDGIILYKNNGLGVFTFTGVTEETISPYDVFAADIDGDGIKDILSASQGDYKIAWYRNQGNGFSSQNIVTDQCKRATSITAFDVDNDGDNDIVSGAWGSDEIVVHYNNGMGEFYDDLLIDRSQNSGVVYLFEKDIDGDGDIDLLTSNHDDFTVTWLINNGNGIFDEEIIVSDEEIQVNCAVAADFDNDGDIDVYSTSAEYFDGGWFEKVKWHENLGDNLSYQTSVLKEFEYFALNVAGDNRLKIADVDADGLEDLLGSIEYKGQVLFFKNNPQGNLNEPIVVLDETNGLMDFSLGFGNDDSFPDLFCCFSGGPDWIKRYDNDGNGEFIEYDGPMFSSSCRCLHTADLNADGYSDIAFGQGNYFLHIINSNGQEGYENLTTISDEINLAHQIKDADLDDDGDLDLIVITHNDGQVSWHENLGYGFFENSEVITQNTPGGKAIKVVDLDNDGDLDIISASQFDDKISFYPNTHGEGCIDPQACNFDPNAWIMNDSCCYVQCGCTNPLATNYMETANCDDHSCRYKISGKVYFDENEDGILDENEYGLPFQAIAVEPLGLTLITNDEGDYSFTMIESNCKLDLISNQAFPYSTTENPILFSHDSSESTEYNFGVSNELPDFAVCIDLYPNGNGFLCNDYANHNMCFRNMGNVPIDGIIELEYDSLFQGHQEVTPIDSVDGNTVYLSFENLLPGEMFFYDIELLTPTVDHIGEFVSSVAKVYGFYEDDQVAYGEQELTMEITCAYDPNDKQAFPLGYTDEHWLLPETEQEFLVRFQNTGNAPAQDVRIQDTIDVNYDLSTFKMVANSHSVMTSINEQTRVIDFFFQDIQLPDSVNNEPDSHGLVSYAITPFADLPVGTELNNTAFIYFDNNEAIVTNTTWTTIHECGGEAAFETSVTEICTGESIDFTSTYEQVETHQWNIDAASENTEESFSKTFTESGEYIIQLVAENPLCSASSMQLVSVYENPSSEFEYSDLEICSLDFIDVQATGDFVQDYEWYLENDLVGTEQTESIQIEGAGEHEIKLITHNEICQDLQTISVLANPNPEAEITENGALLDAGEGEFYLWFLNGELIPNANEQSYEVVLDGAYSVIVINEHWCSVQSEEIMVVNISEVSSPIVLLYPNPLREKSVLEFKDSSPRSVRMIDSQGKEVAYWGTINTDILEIYKAGLSIGNYSILVTEAGKTFVINLLVE